MLAPHLGGLAPPPREILDPPLKGTGVRAERVVMALQSNASWIMVTWNPPTNVNRQTDITENITFSHIRWTAVKTQNKDANSTELYH